MRKLLGIKRKSSETLDRVEDGAKARDIEESITKHIFNYIKKNDFLEGITDVDSDLIDAIPEMIGDREAAWLSEAHWNTAILASARIMKQLIGHKGGRVICNLTDASVEFEPHQNKLSAVGL